MEFENLGGVSQLTGDRVKKLKILAASPFSHVAIGGTIWAAAVVIG